MNLCKNCGAELKEGTAFCGNCGAKQEDAVVPKKKGKGLIIGIIAAVAVLMVTLICTCIILILSNTVDNGPIPDVPVVSDDVADDSKEYVQGIVGEYTYKSEFIDLGYVIRDGWAMYTDEEMELFTEDDGVTTYEMAAYDMETGESILIMTERLLYDCAESEYIEQLRESIESDPEMNVIASHDGISFNIGGHLYSGCALTVLESGYEVTETFYVRKIDNYMVTIMTITIDNDSNSHIMDGFSPYSI